MASLSDIGNPKGTWQSDQTWKIHRTAPPNSESGNKLDPGGRKSASKKDREPDRMHSRRGFTSNGRRRDPGRSVTGDGNRWRQYSEGNRKHKAKVNQSEFPAETRVDCCSSQSYEKFGKSNCSSFIRSKLLFRWVLRCYSLLLLMLYACCFSGNWNKLTQQL